MDYEARPLILTRGSGRVIVCTSVGAKGQSEMLRGMTWDAFSMVAALQWLGLVAVTTGVSKECQ